MDSSHKHYMHIHQNKMKLLNGKTGTFVSSNKNPSNWEIYIPKPYWCVDSRIIDKSYPAEKVLCRFFVQVCSFVPNSPQRLKVNLFHTHTKATMGQVRPKVNKMYIIGLSKFTKKRYKCYLPGTKGKVFVTMNKTFHKDVPCYSL